MRTAAPSTPTSVAAEWEEAMLQSCFVPIEDAPHAKISYDTKSNNNNNNNSIKLKSKRMPKRDPLGRFGDNDDKMIHEQQSGLAQLSSESTTCSFTSFDSSDSDISLCRNTSPSHKNSVIKRQWRPSPSPSKNSSDTDIQSAIHPTATTTTATTATTAADEEDDDGDCSAITAVSLVNLFMGPGGPCSLHLESDEGGVEVVQAELLLTNSSSNNNSNTIGSKTRPILKDTETATKSMSTSNSSNSRNIRFGRVHVRQFGISISENPCVSEGPPIQLSWDYSESPALSVDQFEAIRLPRRRRRLQEFLLSERERRRMLLERYSHQDITECIRNVEGIKRQRVLTYLMLPASALDEAAEDMVRYVTHVFQ